jgi:hypothetical protein
LAFLAKFGFAHIESEIGIAHDLAFDRLRSRSRFRWSGSPTPRGAPPTWREFTVPRNGRTPIFGRFEHRTSSIGV